MHLQAQGPVPALVLHQLQVLVLHQLLCLPAHQLAVEVFLQLKHQ
jgi:hypothetical protein